MKYLSNPDMLLGLMRQMLSGMEVTLPLFLAGAFYLLMNTVVEVVFDRLNKRMDYYRG